MNNQSITKVDSPPSISYSMVQDERVVSQEVKGAKFLHQGQQSYIQ